MIDIINLPRGCASSHSLSIKSILFDISFASKSNILYAIGNDKRANNIEAYTAVLNLHI